MISLLQPKDFHETIRREPGLCLIQLKVEWNGACQIFSPLFDELAFTYKDVLSCYTLQVEESDPLLHELGVHELPYLLFYRNGKMTDCVRGLRSRNHYIMKIEQALMNIQENPQ